MLQTEPVVVLGCHRSGTSLLSQALAAAGVDMGVSISTKKESALFLLLNIKVLEFLSCDWDEPELVLKMLDALEPEQRAKLTQVIETTVRSQFDEFFSTDIDSLWGFKDPRTVVLWQLYADAFANPRKIILTREVEDIASSLYRRSQKIIESGRSTSRTDTCATLDGATQVAQVYCDALDDLSDDEDLYLSYEEMQARPGEASRKVEEFLAAPSFNRHAFREMLGSTERFS